MLCTMVDGKVCQALTSTSSASVCIICGAKPSEMNHLELIKRKILKKDGFQYGLQTLHAWIRFMECILHIAYRLPFKNWCAKGNDKVLLAEKKRQIQKDIRNELGLLVDMVKQGSGSTNDGNTSRTFFRNYQVVARITGANEELIKRLYIILQMLAGSQKVDVQLFKKFSYETAELYTKEYSWYYMPAAMHKILIHGADIMDSFSLPIGMMSEEPQESNNKELKACRQYRARKCSRILTNLDMIHYLLLSSDPYVTSLRTNIPKKRIPLLPEAKAMLIE